MAKKNKKNQQARFILFNQSTILKTCSVDLQQLTLKNIFWHAVWYYINV